MTVSLIVAMSENRVIGVDNDLPWHLPADLKFFKATTMAKPMIMGRKTFDSIGRPLPGRQTIVVTRNSDWSHDGVDVAPDLTSAIELAENKEEVMVTGGAQIYALAMDMVDRMYITEVALTIEDGHAFFPEFSDSDWKEVSREAHPAEDDKPAYAFVCYERA